MVFQRTGRVRGDFYALGVPGVPVYLLDGDHPVLFDAGFTCLGRIYEEAIREVLSDRPPEILVLTHAHFDHCGAAAHLKNVFPSLKIAASARAAEILKRPNAIRLIRDLNIQAASMELGVSKDRLTSELFETFDIDMILSEGRRIPVGENVTVEVLETPGHTWDFLSYYVPERKILVASEAVGCADMSGHIFTEFLVDFDAYLDSLKRLSALEVDICCQGHLFVHVDEDASSYLARSIASAKTFRARLEELLLAEDGDTARVAAMVKEEEYDPLPGPKQMEAAYLLNLNARIKHIADRYHWGRRSR